MWWVNRQPCFTKQDCFPDCIRRRLAKIWNVLEVAAREKQMEIVQSETKRYTSQKIFNVRENFSRTKERLEVNLQGSVCVKRLSKVSDERKQIEGAKKM